MTLGSLDYILHWDSLNLCSVLLLTVSETTFFPFSTLRSAFPPTTSFSPVLADLGDYFGYGPFRWLLTKIIGANYSPCSSETS